MARSDLETALRRLTAAQGGAVHRAQLLASGADRWWIQRRIASGTLERRQRGVLCLAGTVDDVRRRRWEALLGGGPDAVLSHRTAAAIHELGSHAGSRAEIIVPWPSHPRLTGVVVHQLGDLEPRDRTIVDGFPVTTVARTCGDLAAVASMGRLVAAIDEALVRRQLSRGDLADVAVRLARPGKPGARRLASAAAARLDGAPPPESELERRLEEALAEAGLPRPVRQHETPGGRVDFAYPEVKLAIEADGRRWHERADRMLADRRRDRSNAAAGWTTVRCMWEDVIGRRPGLVSELRSVWTTATTAAA